MHSNNENKWRPWLIYFVISSFLIYEMALQVYPSIITEQLHTTFNLTAYQLGVLSGVYFYTYTLMQIPSGILFDRFKLKHVIILPILICTLGAFLFSQMHSYLDGMLARILIGAGSAFAFNGALTVAADLFPRYRFALLAGITQLLAALGPIAGGAPLLPLLNKYGWRTTLLLLAMIGLILAVMAALFANYKKTQTLHKHEQPSILSSLKTICLNPQTWVIASYACLLWAPMAAFASLWGIPYLMYCHHLTKAAATGACATMWLGIAAASPLLGWWSDYIRNRKLPLCLAASIGFIAFSIMLFAHSLSLTSLYLLLFFAGAACAGQALSFASVRENNSASHQSTALSFNNMAVVIAGAIFQPFIGAIIDWQTNHSVVNSAYSAPAYQTGISILALCYGLGILISLLLIKDKPAAMHNTR